MAKDNSFGGASLFDVRMAVVIGVLVLVGGTVAAFLYHDGFRSELALDIVADFSEIIKIAAGGALITIGIAVGRSMANNNIDVTDNIESKPDPPSEKPID